MNSFIMSEFNEQLRIHQPVMYSLLQTSKKSFRALQSMNSESGN